MYLYLKDVWELFTLANVYLANSVHDAINKMAFNIVNDNKKQSPPKAILIASKNVTC